jgi:hypothetical protein
MRHACPGLKTTFLEDEHAQVSKQLLSLLTHLKGSDAGCLDRDTAIDISRVVPILICLLHCAQATSQPAVFFCKKASLHIINKAIRYVMVRPVSPHSSRFALLITTGYESE